MYGGLVLWSTLCVCPCKRYTQTTEQSSWFSVNHNEVWDTSQKISCLNQVNVFVLHWLRLRIKCNLVTQVAAVYFVWFRFGLRRMRLKYRTKNINDVKSYNLIYEASVWKLYASALDTLVIAADRTASWTIKGWSISILEREPPPMEAFLFLTAAHHLFYSRGVNATCLQLGGSTC